MVQLSKLYREGASRIKHDLNIESIIKTLRDLKIYFKKNLLDEDQMFQIQHHHKNVIDLEETTHSEEEVVDNQDNEARHFEVKEQDKTNNNIQQGLQSQTTTLSIMQPPIMLNIKSRNASNGLKQHTSANTLRKTEST